MGKIHIPGRGEVVVQFRLGELLQVEEVLELGSLQEWEKALSSISVKKLLTLFSIGTGLPVEEIGSIEGIGLHQIAKVVGDALAEALGGSRRPFPQRG